MKAPRKTTRILVLLGGYVGLAHYAFGLFIVTWAATVSDSPEIYIRFALPYVGITGIFVVSIFLGHFRRLRASTTSKPPRTA